MAVLGVMLMPASFAHASAQDDTYIAGYAAGVLKHGLKLDIPSLMVRDGVITLPVGGLEAAYRAQSGTTRQHRERWRCIIPEAGD